MAKFQVTVNKLGADPAALLKALRAIADVDLKEAKSLAAFAGKTPCTLVAGVDQEVAQHIAGLLKAAGADSSIEPSSAVTPLFLHPTVDGRFQWNRLRGRIPAI